MGAALMGGNVVGIGKDAFSVAVSILQGHLHTGAVYLLEQGNRLGKEGFLGPVQVLYKVGDAALIIEFPARFFALALVGQHDGDAAV